LSARQSGITHESPNAEEIRDMKRRTLDFLFSAGGMVLALLLFVMGIVLTTNANFAKDYVHDQLGAQKITFKTTATLTEEERKAPCLVKYAGQPLTTGKQAECYANEFIALHVRTATNDRTYAELGVPQSELRTKLTAATAAKDTALAADLQKQLDEISGVRETAFKGETLRGLLLTSFGFSEFGRKGGQAATVAYGAAALLLLLSIAGFVHAYTTPADRVIKLGGQSADRRPVVTV
jgi:hypothetical protein